MAGEGQLLKAARVEKKWSLADTEETTKISVRYIQALEEENYEILPGTTYVKGYLRTYAKQLGLNPDEIIALYKSSLAQEEPIPEPFRALKKSRPIWVRPAVIGILAIVAMGLVISIATLSHNEKNYPYVPAALPSAPKVEAASPKKESDTPSLSLADTGVSLSPDNPASQSSQSNAQEGLTAQLVFTRDCWIEARIDGQQPFQAEYQAGTSKEVRGISKIELVCVGNAGGLSVTLNGKTLPSLGTAGQVVRNIILTQDTLKSL